MVLLGAIEFYRERASQLLLSPARFKFCASARKFDFGSVPVRADTGLVAVYPRKQCAHVI